MGVLKSFIYFIIIFGLIVSIHELGHLLAAKYFNVYCDEFSFGMGPKLFGYQGKETAYNVRAFPLGGFVSMAGESETNLDEGLSIPHERTINGIKKWQQVIVMLAGIVMNLVLGFVVAVLINVVAQERLILPAPIVSEVTSESPADLAGFQANDEIIEVIYPGNISIKPKFFTEVGQYMSLYQGDTTTFIVNRQGEVHELQVQPEFDPESNRYLIGIVGPQAKVEKVTFLTAFKYGFEDFKQNATMIKDSLRFLIRGKGLNQVSGPIGILDITGQAMDQTSNFQEGLLTLLSLISLLSINLGIFNLLPIPMLDGGRVVMVLYEMIFKKEINEKVEYALMALSLGFILVIFIFSTWNDISRLLFR